MISDDGEVVMLFHQSMYLEPGNSRWMSECRGVGGYGGHREVRWACVGRAEEDSVVREESLVWVGRYLEATQHQGQVVGEKVVLRGAGEIITHDSWTSVRVKGRDVVTWEVGTVLPVERERGESAKHAQCRGRGYRQNNDGVLVSGQELFTVKIPKRDSETPEDGMQG
jgi:hypothetical protein